MLFEQTFTVRLPLRGAGLERLKRSAFDSKVRSHHECCSWPFGRPAHLGGGQQHNPTRVASGHQREQGSLRVARNPQPSSAEKGWADYRTESAEALKEPPTLGLRRTRKRTSL